eukprot:312692_1
MAQHRSRSIRVYWQSVKTNWVCVFVSGIILLFYTLFLYVDTVDPIALEPITRIPQSLNMNHTLPVYRKTNHPSTTPAPAQVLHLKPRKRKQTQDYQQMVEALKDLESLEYIQDNISTSTDVIKYRKTNHTLCDAFYVSKYLIGAHHKTGSVLMNWHLSQQGVKYYLDHYCSWDNDSTYRGKAHSHQTKIYNYHLSELYIRYWTSGFAKSNRRFEKPVHAVVINMIRNPVDTILSSYNYHTRGPEEWTRVPLYNIGKFKTSFNERQEIMCSKKLFMNLTQQMDLDSNVTIQDLYTDILSEHQGIYYEFMRYSECCWWEIYSSYETMNKIMDGDMDILEGKDTDLIHAKQFRLENFFVDFNRSCNEYLDVMGILDDVDRNTLMNKFQRWKYDTKDKEKVEGYMRHKHVTVGQFDKKSQIELLLQIDVNTSTYWLESARDRCILLKEKTILLGYQWQFDGLC